VGLVLQLDNMLLLYLNSGEVLKTPASEVRMCTNTNVMGAPQAHGFLVVASHEVLITLELHLNPT
ncbi:hypothetical protein P7K49_006505, partial [Saguinus oedipus]